MSWWIYLEDPETAETLPVSSHSEGGTYAVGGTSKAELNVTYNYAVHFSFRGLHGKTGAETIATLQDPVATLGTERDSDYWSSTPGNAGYACSILLSWAQLHPTGRWRVS